MDKNEETLDHHTGEPEQPAQDEQTKPIKKPNNEAPVISAEEALKRLIQLDTMTRWPDSFEMVPEITPPPVSENQQATTPRIPHNEDINSKLILWQGDPTRLDVDVLVNLTDENLADFSFGVAAHIFRAISEDNLELFINDCRMLAPCRAGNVIVSNGFNLFAKKLIHAVGPRFNPKHKIAAENILNTTYRRCLETCVDEGFASLALPCIHLTDKNFPIDVGSHVALRTIRRFLEKWGDKIETIVLVMIRDTELEAYKSNLPLYFPRTENEAQTANYVLPKNIGNDIGAIEIEGRGIRISASPGTRRSPSIRKSSASASTNLSTDSNGLDSFRSVSRDIDDVRREQFENRSKEEALEEQREVKYQRYLRVAQQEDLSDIAILDIVYQCGVDRAGRPIVLLIPGNIPENLDLGRLFLQMIKVMDKIVEKDYVAIFFHTDIHGNKPSNAWFKAVYQSLPRKYKKNVKQFYIVHPTIWFKMGLWFMRAIISEKFWDKLYFIDSLRELFSHIDREQLRIPEDIVSFEQRMGIVPPSQNL